MHLFYPRWFFFQIDARDPLLDHVVLSLKALLWLLFGQRIKLGLCTLSLSTSPVLGLLSLTTRFYYSGLPSVWASLVAQMVKESACHVEELGSIPGFGCSPGGGHCNPLQFSCLETPHGQRSLVGYSPWGHKELDMTGQLSTAQSSVQWTHQDCLPMAPLYLSFPPRGMMPDSLSLSYQLLEVFPSCCFFFSFLHLVLFLYSICHHLKGSYLLIGLLVYNPSLPS